MKKFIIMSLAIFALALTVGCKKNGDECGDDEKWDKDKEECVAKEEVMTQAKCEAKGAGYVWDAANNACNTVTPAAAAEKVYTITNKLAEALTVTSGDMSVSLIAATAVLNDCANVKESQFAALVLASTAFNCDNGNKQADGTTDKTDDDCAAKAANNYDVNPAVVASPPNSIAGKPAGLTVSAAAGTNCKDLAATPPAQ